MAWVTYWHWFTFGLILIIAESLGAAGFLIAIGMAAGMVGLTMLFLIITWQWQLTLFSIMSILFALIWWRILQKRAQERPMSTLNRPMEAMIGMRAVLIEPIKNGQGKIRVNDATWFVTGPELMIGTTVRIIGVDKQNSLIVESAE